MRLMLTIILLLCITWAFGFTTQFCGRAKFSYKVLQSCQNNDKEVEALTRVKKGLLTVKRQPDTREYEHLVEMTVNNLSDASGRSPDLLKWYISAASENTSEVFIEYYYVERLREM